MFPFILELSLPQMCLSLIILHVKDGAESVLHVLIHSPKTGCRIIKTIRLLWILGMTTLSEHLCPCSKALALTTEIHIMDIFPLTLWLHTPYLKEPHLPWSSLTPYAWSASWPLQRSVKWIPGNTMNCHDNRTLPLRWLRMTRQQELLLLLFQDI